MARDLIPPPSPAGRPAPDPERAADPVAAAQEATQDTSRPAGPSPFGSRFGLVTGVLVGCALVAVVLAVVLASTGGGRSDETASDGWSTWRPSSSKTIAGAAQIAQHVQFEYRDQPKTQLVSVTSGPIQIDGVPLSVALRSAQGTIKIVEGTGVQYTLNGLGSGGTIDHGKPSAARHRLLRREALELALYSFHYLPDVKMVVALLPPATTAKSQKAARTGTQTPGVDQQGREHQAIFYRPADLRAQLDQPLGRTLASSTPTLRELNAPGVQAATIDKLTIPNLFLVSYAQAQDARSYLVLFRP